MYEIKIKKDAKKALDRAPAHIKKKIEAELLKVAAAPRSQKPLQGFEDTYRIRAGDWRAVYEVDDGTITVTVLKVGPRGGVYKGN